MADVPLEQITEYAAEDADVALRLAPGPHPAPGGDGAGRR